MNRYVFRYDTYPSELPRWGEKIRLGRQYLASTGCHAQSEDLFYIFLRNIRKSGLASAIRRKPSSLNVMGAGTALPTGGGAISTRDMTGVADNPSHLYAWKSDEIALIGAIMGAVVIDSAEPGTVMHGSPASPAAIETSRYPLSRAVALLTGKWRFSPGS